MHDLRYRLLDRALARGLPPDGLLRFGTRMMASYRLRRLSIGGLEAQEERRSDFALQMTSGPIAEVPASANEQHYELPAEFLGLFLGPRRKYSSAWWPAPVRDLASAEEAMLDLTARRAGVEDGMAVLDLGCGWGAMSIWLAEQYDVEVTAVSNSHRQREWIEAECERRGIAGQVHVITADINDFDPGRRFDRIVSIEMFEHVRNWQELLHRIGTWLEDDGACFVHVFAHRCWPYLFEGTWAADRFFTAGRMPSPDLLLRLLPPELRVARTWALDGTHYQRTLEGWLDRLTHEEPAAVAVLEDSGLSRAEAQALVGKWRLFLLATAEMWGYRDGQEWMVCHYLLHRSAVRTISGPGSGHPS